MAINNVGRALSLPTQPSKPADGNKPAGMNASHAAPQAAASSAMSQLSGAVTGPALEAGDTPVDLERVAALKAAIEDGSYQVDLEQVARGMVDLEAQLNGK